MTTEQPPSGTDTIENFVFEPTYAPIDEYVDLSDSFSSCKGDPFVDGKIKSTLTCAEQDKESYAQSDECIEILDGSQSIRVLCTWGPQERNVYLGLRHVNTGKCYILPSVGGSTIGAIDLAVVPAGEYCVILYSNDNPSVIAVLHYQIV